jgi:hypothetical protein
MKLRVSGLNEPVAIRQANASQLWAYVEKLLSFEEPDSRFERQSKVIAKHSGLPLKLLSQLPLAGQEEVICAAYSKESADGNAYHKQECLLACVLALEELKRFQSVVFESWRFASVGQSISSSKAHGRDFKWIEELAETADQSLWIEHAYKSAPQFSLLKEPGSWSEDARAQIILACLESFGQYCEHEKSTRVKEAQELFRQLVKEKRKQLPGSFLPEVVLLVEGQSEAMILPHLTSYLSVDLDALAVHVTACGGAKQVARRFLELRDVTRLPIMVVLDDDAQDESQIVQDMLRPQDRLHILSKGEIEDIFEPAMLIDILNKQLSSLCPSEPILVSDLTQDYTSDAPIIRRTELLDRLWRKRGLGDFDKIGFAKTVIQTIVTPQAVPGDIKRIAEKIKELAETNYD